MSKHEIDVDTGASYGNYQSYVIGFASSIFLTLISFYLVATAALSPQALYVAIGGLAVMQLFVQAVFFLHLNRHSNSAWNLLSFLFTLVMVTILVVGTMWIMYNLYTKMGMDAMSM